MKVCKLSHTDIVPYNSLSHSGYFYSASSSPLLLKGAPVTARLPPTVSEFHSEAPQATACKGRSLRCGYSETRTCDPSNEGRRIYLMNHHATTVLMIILII